MRWPVQARSVRTRAILLMLDDARSSGRTVFAQPDTRAKPTDVHRRVVRNIAIGETND